MPHDHMKCSDCGTVIDADAETTTSCPNCGISNRTITASGTSGRPSDYMLDNFVAHKLSSLTDCGAPEITSNGSWLGAFILNSVFIANLAPEPRSYAFNFLRRAEGALSSYRSARLDLIEYFQTPRNVLSPYFKALLNFEVCISQSYQGLELLATAGRVKVFDKGDDSKEERLERLYVQSKHMDRMIVSGQIPTEATAALWITNQGLECSKAELSFEELQSILNWLAAVADRISRFDFSSGDQS
jgi:predicted RNA-binding Zn-ribbon protein involved in translation (DUF1610 family)